MVAGSKAIHDEVEHDQHRVQNERCGGRRRRRLLGDCCQKDCSEITGIVALLSIFVLIGFDAIGCVAQLALVVRLFFRAGDLFVVCLSLGVSCTRA